VPQADILVTTWAYQILTVEMKNFAKVSLLSFNETALSLYDVIVSENDVLETR